YQIVVWPLRAIRYSYWHGCYGPRHPLAVLGDTVVGLVFVAAAIWLADRYVPHVHEALMNLPAALHQTADAVRDWWNRK
ncbi:MAG TPA: hypothetical protein VFJ90_10900, partial [Candidatus Didemnitutus sp.]|nr:hypothetical protein [Candidatus Didemnitutus sp.]